MHRQDGLSGDGAPNARRGVAVKGARRLQRGRPEPAAAAMEMAGRTPMPVPEAPPAEDAPPLRPVDRARLVAQVVEELPEGEVFGPSRLAEEANRRYGRQLGKPVDARMASGILRRLLAEGTVRLVQKGGSHREALYGRG